MAYIPEDPLRMGVAPGLTVAENMVLTERARHMPGGGLLTDWAAIRREIVVDKPGKGSFYATDLDMLLRTRGSTHLVITGITTDVCVHTTMRDANDRGYECLLLEDCTGATDEGNYRAAIQMIKMQGGVFWSVSNSREFLRALRTLS